MNSIEEMKNGKVKFSIFVTYWIESLKEEKIYRNRYNNKERTKNKEKIDYVEIEIEI